MGKKQQDTMGQVYREFSRQKYNKYKHQYPNLRESEIVGKIIKEWETLNSIAKDNLKKLYLKKNYLTSEDISSSEALQRATSKQKERTTTPKKIASSKPSAKRKSESDAGRRSSQRDDSKPVDSDSFGQARSPKVKRIIKASKIDYVGFYKEQSTKLHREHPRWNQSQISSIIRMEWKKRKLQLQKSQRMRMGQRRSLKMITGYKFFRKERRLDHDEAVKRWKRFPS